MMLHSSLVTMFLRNFTEMKRTFLIHFQGFSKLTLIGPKLNRPHHSEISLLAKKMLIFFMIFGLVFNQIESLSMKRSTTWNKPIAEKSEKQWTEKIKK